jgi:endonuclease/exonuclease/phosphatase family metal-dependent hydrolase
MKTWLLMLLLPAMAVSAEPVLKVMSFNVRNSAAQDGTNAWPNRRALLLDTIRAFDPDLLGTQEVLADQWNALQAGLPGMAALGVARDDGKRKGEWSPVLYRTSRFEVVTSGTFWLSETPDVVASRSWDASLTRICTWAQLRERSTGRELWFANTHFDHKGPGSRTQSARLLTTRFTRQAGEQAVVVTGDFNSTEDDESWRTLTAVWADSYREVHPQRAPDEATFHGFKGGVAGSRIDWILHSRGFTATEASIVRPGQPPYPSDHYPVTAVLRWGK